MSRKRVIFIVLLLVASLISFGYVNPDYESPIVKVVKESAPAVVKIDVSKTTYTSFDPFMDEFFRKFFGEDEIPWGLKRRTTAIGSGFVFDEKGYILTNEHVVHNAESITVTFLDGSKFRATYIGGDEELDIAVIKIDPKGKELKVLEFGDSDKLEIGEWAIAIGNPLGLQHTVTIGVVSALHRKIPKPDGSGYYTDLIQTDAAINPGNSGGPLLNIHGQVIGINTAIINPMQGVNLGFAIAINKVKQFLGDLISTGRIRKAWLGVYIQDITEELARALGIRNRKGVLVTQVVEGSPADKAGIMENDIIRKVDGDDISNAEELVSKIRSYKPGTTVTLEIERNGRILELDVKLGELSKEKTKETRVGLGITVGEITPADRERYSIPKDLEGVIVRDVDPDSIAYKMGIRRGDVVLRVNRMRIRNLQDWENAISGLKKGNFVAIMTYRRGVRRYVAFSIQR